jgi:hypothetical protein
MRENACVGALSKVAQRSSTALASVALIVTGQAWSLVHVERAGSSTRASYVIAPEKVGRLEVGPGTTYRRALRYFESSGSLHPTATFSIWGCNLISRRTGLAFEFNSSSYIVRSRATPAGCTGLFGVSVSRPAWHTQNGLHVGASLQERRNLFPKASDEGLGKPPPGVSNWCAYWVLSAPTIPGPGLFAYVTRGHIAALGIGFLGH